MVSCSGGWDSGRSGISSRRSSISGRGTSRLKGICNN